MRMYTVDMRDINGNIVKAKVGDTVAAYCYIFKGVRVGKIQGIKKGFKIENFKITPAASKCIFVKRRLNT